MTDEQVKEQQINRTNSIDLYESISLNKTKPGLFEIQNTMEETVLIEDEKNRELNEDTEPEDNACDDNLNNTSCPDFRLHMSSSFINQSVVSNKSLQIPETMTVEEEEEEKDENEVKSEVENKKLDESIAVIVNKENSDNKSDDDSAKTVDTEHSVEVNQTNDQVLLDEKKSSNNENNLNEDKTKVDKNEEKNEKINEILIETKSDFEVKKYKSINDESIIINDDDEDYISLDKANTQKNLIVAEEKSSNEILDTSAVTEKNSQLNETPVRRGRGRPRSSVGVKQDKSASLSKSTTEGDVKPENSVQQHENAETSNEAAEEKPIAKVGRRSSLRVKNTPNPVVRPKRAVKMVEEETEELKDHESDERRKSVGVGAKKSSEKNRRKTIDASSVLQVPKRKVGRPRLIREEEKLSPKRKSDEDENIQPKKNRPSKKQQESSDDEDNETLENVKKMLRKQSADKAQHDSTPKIFFNSKRRNTPNSSLNQTPKTNDSADTPSKKFKLHKAISSSEENLDQSSAEEVVDKSKEPEDKAVSDDAKQEETEEVLQADEEEQIEQQVENEKQIKTVKKVGRPALSRLPVASARHSARTNRSQN